MDTRQQSQYDALVHRRQSATAIIAQHPPYGPNVSAVQDRATKHLRVGIDTALAGNGAIAKLLVAKGLVTHEEMSSAILEAERQETERAEDEARKILGVGREVSFG